MADDVRAIQFHPRPVGRMAEFRIVLGRFELFGHALHGAHDATAPSPWPAAPARGVSYFRRGTFTEATGLAGGVGMKTLYARSLHWLAMLGCTLLGASIALSLGALMG
ncbi:hypothetical protein GCM10007235_07040 [Pseudoxanthomonas indica]|nr:hypothetical protein GCM10007235_07040 [Pseudoxanthomonas indica]